jgi:hypothetical protein
VLGSAAAETLQKREKLMRSGDWDPATEYFAQLVDYVDSAT